MNIINADKKIQTRPMTKWVLCKYNEKKSNLYQKLHSPCGFTRDNLVKVKYFPVLSVAWEDR